MSLEFVKHEKLSLLKHPIFNEKWLQDRISDDTSILGLGDTRLLDRERSIQGGGRLDLLLLDEDKNCRYEVEIQLGATDPSHIIRCIEYWDVERRRYPGYDHVAVLVAENITSRFLNVMSLLAGSIPMIAIQLDALTVGEQLLLNFTQVLDQTELRIDDTEDDSGGEATTRAYWDKKAGKPLMTLCDEILKSINESSRTTHALTYLKHYIGLQSNGVVNNFMHMSPKRTKHFIHVSFRNSDFEEWLTRFGEAEIPASSKRKGQFWISVTPDEHKENIDLIKESIASTVKEFEG